MHVGDKVQVSLSSSAPAQGTVVRIGRVATDASSEQNQNGQGRNEQGQDRPPPSVAITVQVDLPAGGELDQAPVQVAITTVTRQNVLLVPVIALLARPGGGYQVRLSAGGYVAVTPGCSTVATEPLR